MAPPFEYRVFLPSLPLSLSGVDFDKPNDRAEVVRHLYVLSPDPNCYNVKIRDQRLDIKALVDQEQGLERWQVLPELRFPITRRDLIHDVLQRLDVETPALLHRTYSVSRLIRQVVVPSEELEFREVKKRKVAFTRDGCDLEVVEVDVANYWRCVSVAAKSQNARSVLDLLDRLQIYEHPNQSYPAFIKSVARMFAPTK